MGRIRALEQCKQGPIHSNHLLPVSTECFVVPQDNVTMLVDPLVGAGGIMLNLPDKVESATSICEDYGSTIHEAVPTSGRDSASINGNTAAPVTSTTAIT
jgi:hypothetical protein